MARKGEGGSAVTSGSGTDDGATVLRPIEPGDARAFLALFEALDAESEFMLYEPGERVTTLAELRARIVQGRRSGRETLIGAVRLDARRRTTLDGFVGAMSGSGYRNAHALTLVLGVRRAASGRGLGRRLLAAIEADARDRGIRRLGLGVMANNARALRLYERAGFVREGRRRDAVRLRSGYVDEWFMGKLLGP